MGVDVEMLVEFYKGGRVVTTLGSYGTAYKKIVQHGYDIGRAVFG